jgi:hypothetical protein
MTERRLLAEARAIASPLRRFRGVALTGAAMAALATAPAVAQADVWGTNFESPSYKTGQNIDVQAGWSDYGLYDSNAVKLTDYPNAALYGFGSKALQISNFQTSGSFGDQTFTPSVADEAGEPGAANAGLSGGIRQTQFNARWRIGVADPSSVPGGGEDRHMSVSADRGDGARMSYLRFEDQADGIHVFFIDVPSPTTTLDPTDGKNHVDFVETQIAVLDRTQAHLVSMSIDFVPGPTNGPANDVVNVSIDGALLHTGTSWENYFRHDEEAAGSGNQVPTVDSLLFAERGGDNSGQQGKGFLVDDLRIETTTPGANQGPVGPTGAQGPAGGTGATGGTGAAGATGAQGTTGPQGTVGPTGAAGAAGTNGTNGTNGINGATGPQGLAGQSTPAGQAEPNPVVVVSTSLKPDSKGRVSVKLACPTAARLCDGRVTLTIGSKSIGSAPFFFKGGKSKTLRIKLSAASLKAALKKKKVSASVFSRDAVGTAAETAKVLAFKK